MHSLLAFRNVSVIFLHDIRRQEGDHNMRRLLEFYTQSGFHRTYKLCWMSEDLIRELRSQLELGGDPHHGHKRASRLPTGHISHLLWGQGYSWANMAFLVKDRFWTSNYVIPNSSFSVEGVLKAYLP